ncbi:PREDICTED: zinc finger protein 26-like [Papilio xuthus]|uniref:Zinc finger protein 26-like n=1 Tax=Papilio xuthus TaxID=66420 RepID=A0A194PTL2_PAPXU|nr:PREDICTED: zinc finger protein 26-like [Papilio xuthus]XP_013179436.1 PREDICTED: zinc finger protein 26-like [Papilio xuthus]KPI96751.1 Zinc finger protein 37-like [Papilio xuthus]
MAETASLTCSPKYLHKKRRLSRLLDKLAVQLQNNNHYPLPPWLMLDPPYYETKTQEDAPLDLSVKSEQPKVEKEPDGYSCATCGQTFALHDRLAKHIASRHADKTPESARAYECEICRRRFARSDMLTRHARLHTGIKPYSCSACGQVFSRSDHLATHQRTHTGEKPYRCPVCPYAACRRDMITRHMRTHSRPHCRSQPRPQPAEI